MPRRRCGDRESCAKPISESAENYSVKAQKLNCFCRSGRRQLRTVKSADRPAVRGDERRSFKQFNKKSVVECHPERAFPLAKSRVKLSDA